MHPCIGVFVCDSPKKTFDKNFLLLYYMVTKNGIDSNYLQMKSERRFNIMMNTGFDREVHFEILEHIGVLSTYSTGWNKELNIVSWNGGQPKYDIRDWDLDHEHMSRGVTLHEKEMRQIFDLMKKRRLGNRFKKEEPPQSAPKHDMPSGEQYAGLMQSGAAEEPFETPPPQQMAGEQQAIENVPPELMDAACDESPTEQAAAF